MPTNNWASALKSTYEPPQENSLLAQTGDMATFMDWFCKQRGLSELTPKDLEGPAFEIIKVFHPDVIHLQFQMEECHKLLTDQVDDAIIRYNVSKPLPLGGDPGHVTIQPDFFFNKDLEYLRYCVQSLDRPVITKMKRYYPDVVIGTNWCLISSGLQRNASMTLQLYMETLIGEVQTTTILSLTDFSSEGDREQDRYGVQMIMRFNEIHKFSDGTLQQIDEALDLSLKDFQINRTNTPEGMNTRFGQERLTGARTSCSLSQKPPQKDTTIFRNLRACGGRSEKATTGC
ncbi:hypothetical protein Tco_1066875 [Tanacetum coccineum]